MIIDGKEVLYTMRNGKIVDPNIPTDGLVCYLDARGKTNADKHKGTLLDLSGNGNHGTLQNFNFTEESGYVKGLSGGLQFDGVDDTMSYSHNLERTDPRTIFIDIEIEQTATEQGIFLNLPFGLYIHTENNCVYNWTNRAAFWKEIRKGAHKLVITVESTLETSKLYYLGNVYDIDPQGFMGDYFVDPRTTYVPGKIKLNRAMLYNRVLSDTEITKLMEV